MLYQAMKTFLIISLAFFISDNMTGLNSVYTMFEGHEVMFHVSVMLPYSNDTQQVLVYIFLNETGSF